MYVSQIEKCLWWRIGIQKQLGPTRCELIVPSPQTRHVTVNCAAKKFNGTARKLQRVATTLVQLLDQLHYKIWALSRLIFWLRHCLRRGWLDSMHCNNAKLVPFDPPYSDRGKTQNCYAVGVMFPYFYNSKILLPPKCAEFLEKEDCLQTWGPPIKSLFSRSYPSRHWFVLHRSFWSKMLQCSVHEWALPRSDEIWVTP